MRIGRARRVNGCVVHTQGIARIAVRRFTRRIEHEREFKALYSQCSRSYREIPDSRKFTDSDKGRERKQKPTKDIFIYGRMNPV